MSDLKTEVVAPDLNTGAVAPPARTAGSPPYGDAKAAGLASDRKELDPRTLVLLRAPLLPTLLRMAWPNLLVMLAQASVGLIETWWVSRLGADALTGMAVVFPGFMMMQMLSAGAIGGIDRAGPGR